MTKNRQVLLASRPDGAPSAANFELVESDIPTPGEGQMLLRTIYLSLDPYMRGRMNAEKSYAEPVPVGGVMEGGTVSVVEQSNNGKFQEGDILVGRCGWQDYVVSDGTSLGNVDPGTVPISTALGVLGMPGLTAYSGLLRLGKPKEGRPWSWRQPPVRSAPMLAKSPRSKGVAPSVWRVAPKMRIRCQ